MADVAAPKLNGEKKEKVELVKPERPDEETYRAALKKAEKEHADAMTKFVSLCRCHLRHLRTQLRPVGNSQE